MRYIEYLRIPFKHMGRDEQGADCFGLLRLFYQRELGIALKDYAGSYEPDWWKDSSLLTDNYRKWGFRKTSQPVPGNAILFRNTTEGAGHIGIILDDQYFLHMTKVGACISEYTFGVWARQIHSVYRYGKRVNR